MKKKKIASIHPGEILLEGFLIPMNISQYRLAKDNNVSLRCINEIIHGKRAITSGTALHLGMFFNVSPEFWLNLQIHYDLEVQREKLAETLVNEVQVYAA